MPRHAGVGLAAVLLLVTVAPAAPAAPGDRAAAAAIRQATVDLHQAVVAQAPAAASRPAIHDPVFDEPIRNNKRYDRLDAKLERSGERLRKLGVSKRVVGWWTGDSLLDELDPPDDLLPEGP